MYEGSKAYVKSGDLAYCKACKGTFPILGTAMTMIDGGPMVAYGDRVLCRCPDHWVIAQSTWFCDDLSNQSSSQVTRSSPSVQPSSFAETSTSNSTTPVFAKSCLRGSGCTDAGTAPEPVENFGGMAFYQAAALTALVNTGTTSTTEGIVASVFRYLGGTASRAIIGRFATPNPVTVGLVGVLFSAGLNSGEEDYLDQKRLEHLAAQNGNAPTRVRFEWVMDSTTGKMKVNGYHTGAGMLSSEVPVREMKLDPKTGIYEFWEDGASGPSILWTPDNPGFQSPQHTGNENIFVPPPTITILPIPEETGGYTETFPMPEEKNFRDYILVHPEGAFEPIYIYLAKPPVKLVEVELYSDFEGRSREGLYHADHMPSAAAVRANLKRRYPDADENELREMAKNVAAIIVPAEVHRKISETYGARNTPKQIEEDSWELKSALDRNFEAIRPALKEYSVTESQLEEAKAKMHEINRKQGLY
ncbi:S-type pyocin domain-containing protein [Budviciaceae bacterium CWB-B4]|uniref:S-type pyocin domain-containing protein n=1 Tax=Limnobaculum xujianqingii TaxID=2738837 RepID=A0A9D7AF23_9GAMM|nr:S-type pyocin domain-containing protein [Limnobaculum xujianqingii]MBK5071553.1 S-type pyocin domain-containing protein [Limnobaculum xujianqingii]MBK5174862.1 S-type pyocin domain-containing protein [Limnobaculum xujianqingii]